MSDSAQQSWSIIILCYNEVGNIARVLHTVYELLPALSSAGGELIVVNDGSTDGSHEQIVQFMEKHPAAPINYIHQQENLGIGAALHQGYGQASAENVVMIPGDGQFNLQELLPYKNIAPKTILAFYRVENMTYTLTRNVLSWFNSWLNRLFIGLTLKDVNWVKAYKTAALQDLSLEVKSSLVESEICSKLLYLGHQALEVESKYWPRQTGTSKGASWAIVRQALSDIPILILAFRRFRKKR
ncbi:MAG: glycosyltransferase family 2 protein [Aureispira sp.]